MLRFGVQYSFVFLLNLQSAVVSQLMRTKYNQHKAMTISSHHIVPSPPSNVFRILTHAVHRSFHRDGTNRIKTKSTSYEVLFVLARVDKKDAYYFFENNDLILLKKLFLLGTDVGKGSFNTQGKFIL